MIELLYKYRDLVESALKHSLGAYSFKDIVEAVEDQRMQFWVNDKCCVVTEVLNLPQIKTLHVFLAAGELDGIRSLENDAAEWAKSIGCNAFTLSGRSGWVKALKNDGWEVAHTTMIKRL